MRAGGLGGLRVLVLLWAGEEGVRWCYYGVLGRGYRFATVFGIRGQTSRFRA